jgi:prepilin-type processing-associated H-X9-DG protein
MEFEDEANSPIEARMLAPSARTDHRLVERIIQFLTRQETRSRKFHDFAVARRHGRGPIEILVVLAIIAFALMILLVALPKGRESARMTGCQRNLMQIGMGLQMYSNAQGYFPTVPELNRTAGDSPIEALFDTFVIPDLLEVHDPTRPPRPTRTPPRNVRVPNLTCPTDSNAVGDASSPFNSYRANTGDSSSGRGGPFQPGRRMSGEMIEAADGLSFTAAYAERLVGNRRDGSPATCDYALLNDAVGPASCPDCPVDRWRGDAGTGWAEASWRSTLYNHALVPNAPRSCIAEDGRSALMGASSEHVNRVNVLMMDGSVRGVTPGLNLRVWQAQGTVGPPREETQP